MKVILNKFYVNRKPITYNFGHWKFHLGIYQNQTDENGNYSRQFSFSLAPMAPLNNYNRRHLCAKASVRPGKQSPYRQTFRRTSTSLRMYSSPSCTHKPESMDSQISKRLHTISKRDHMHSTDGVARWVITSRALRILSK